MFFERLIRLLVQPLLGLVYPALIPICVGLAAWIIYSLWRRQNDGLPRTNRIIVLGALLIFFVALRIIAPEILGMYAGQPLF